jgi:hypothetical protein
LAVDGRIGTLWNSGGYPSQWIEVDLQRPTRIAKVQLVGTDRPDGGVFLVLGKGPGTNGAYRLLHEFKGPAADREALVFTPNKPWRGIRYVRVVTPQVSAPVGWVAWREIGVLAAPSR